MTDFQKSLTRSIYLALAVVAALGVWSLARPAPRGQAATGRGYGPYGEGVTATGTCVVRTKPEVAEVVIGVKQSSGSARATQSYVKSTMRKVSKVLKQGGVADKDIQTLRFRLESVWDSGH